MDLAAINDKKILALRTEIEDYKEKIHNDFNSIDNEMDAIKANIDGDSIATIKNKYSNINILYPVIANNIDTVTADLERVVTNYENSDKEIAKTIIDDINNY